MTQSVRLPLVLTTLGLTVVFLAGCAPIANCASGQTECGSGCMPTGNSCCPDGQHNCDSGYTCNATSTACVASGTSGGGASSTSSGSSGTTGSSSMGACGSCSGNLQCSQWISGTSCNWQSCACYFVLNGSDSMKEFYHSSDGQCFQCPTTGTTCQSAAQALINHCYGL